MQQTESPTRPAADWRQLWRFTLDPFATRRRPTREVRVGDIGIGGTNPIRVQSMTIADTLDTETVVAEIEALHAAGSEIVRVTAPNRSSAENLAAIRAGLEHRGVRVPLVADIHFTPQAALIAAQHVEKVRINPGNYADRKHFKKWEYSDAEYAEELARLEEAFRPLVLRCKERGVAMRIGTNHGSLSDRIMNRYGDTPLGMVESALEFVRICEHHGYRELVLSMKASDVKVMIQAYRLLAGRMRELGMDYPFHLGVTEAGAGLGARVKSAIGIASLLADGIGDTVRVSLTEDSVHELPVARALAALYDTRAEGNSGATELAPPRWNPYRFERRACEPLGHDPIRLAADHPPRVEMVLPLDLADPPSIVARVREVVASESLPEGCDGILLAPVTDRTTAEWVPALQAIALWKAARDTRAQPAIGFELPLKWIHQPDIRELVRGGVRLSLRVDLEDLGENQTPWVFKDLPPLQYTLGVAAVDLDRAAAALARYLASGAWPAGAVALDLQDGSQGAAPHACRRLLATWPAASHPPVVLRGPRGISAADATAIDAHVDGGDLRIAAALGSLLADGVGDAVQLQATPDAGAARALATEILQATRLRLVKADFIACPSCGRTQFDLQTTTARIESRLKHLKGLKIAVMGCIVNGPGEMADADFGYVGSGPGKIDLYVGHERVERSLPQDEAVDRLIELIRSRGLWVEPGSQP